MKITKGIIQTPQKITIYGPEGIGKSSLASTFPHPLFVDTEGGTKHLPVDRVDATLWTDVVGVVEAACKDGFEYKTIVIDTVDWAVSLLTADVLKAHKKDSIEDFGYGKGYAILEEEFARFLCLCDSATKAGVCVVFCAHSCVKRTDLPDSQGSYDRYELKLPKRVSPLLKEACDAVLFGQFRTTIVESEGGKNKAVGGKERVLFTTHSAAFDAKNRSGLSERLRFDIQDLHPLFTFFTKDRVPGAPVVVPPRERNVLDRLLDGRPEEDRERVLKWGIQMKQIKAGDGLENFPASLLARISAAPDRFLASVGLEVAK